MRISLLMVLIVMVNTILPIRVSAQICAFEKKDFSKADSVAALYDEHSLHDIKMLANKLTGGLPTEQEKFRAIYRWVCYNIEVDYELVLVNRRKRSQLNGDKLEKWNAKFNRRVFDVLLHERKTLCSGYAYLIRELSYHAGLACKIVNGYAKPGGVNTQGAVNHSWNLIQLNNKWYYCDATWSSGIYNRATGKFVKKYDDRYFLMEPELFVKEHIGEAPSHDPYLVNQ